MTLVDHVKAAGLVKQIDSKFIPIDGTSITVDQNGKLAASGGGSLQLYVHNIYLAGSNGAQCYTTIITNDNTQFTLPTLASYLYSNGLTGFYPNATAMKQVSGKFYNSTDSIPYICLGIASTNGTGVTLKFAKSEDTSGGLDVAAEAINDYVHSL